MALGFLVGFASGTVFGVYLSQHYDIPDIGNMLATFKDTAKKYEKKDEDKKDSWSWWL